MKISPLQAFVWGNNNPVKRLRSIYFHSSINFNTVKYPHANRKLHFKIIFRKTGSFEPYYTIQYDDGIYTVWRENTVVPLSEIGSVEVATASLQDGFAYYLIECNFTYELRNGVIVKGIDPNILELDMFRIRTYVGQVEDWVSVPDVIVLENPNNFSIVGDTAQRNTPTSNAFGFYTTAFPPAVAKKIPELYGYNRMSVRHRN